MLLFWTFLPQQRINLMVWSTGSKNYNVYSMNSLNTIHNFVRRFQCQSKWEDIFKPTIGNKSLHEISGDNGVTIVKFATSKNLIVKSTMFSHHNIHKFTSISPKGNTQNQTDNILIDRRQYSSACNLWTFRAADCDTDHYRVWQWVNKKHTEFIRRGSISRK
jgi:hypothetical protein